MNNLIAYIRLTRPANIITAIADILAGIAVSGATLGIMEGQSGMPYGSLLWLCLATIGLYGGGVAFNDVFDAELDRVERPERPIPSGQVSVTKAGILAGSLLLIGIVAAWQVSLTSGLLALAVALLALLYDAWGKHQLVIGPINMGLCRSGNLLLGVSIIPWMVAEVWYLGLVPLVYIAAITMISRGEVHGQNRKALEGGLLMYIAIIFALFYLAIISPVEWWQVIPFLFLLSYLIIPPLLKALKFSKPALIGKAVKAGVLALIVLNAALASAYSGWKFGVMVLLLLPLSIWMARKFAVT